MKNCHVSLVTAALISTLLFVVALSAQSRFSVDTALIEPHNLIVDRSMPRGQVDAQIIATRRFDTFWNTGDEGLARAARRLHKSKGEGSPFREGSATAGSHCPAGSH